MSAEIGPESEAKMREALADPARFEVTITGRNGFTVTHGFPLYDYEAGEITSSVETKRHEINELGYASPTGWEKLPYSRVISYTLETRIR